MTSQIGVPVGDYERVVCLLLLDALLHQSSHEDGWRPGAIASDHGAYSIERTTNER